MKENSIEEAIERLEYIDRTYSCNNYYSIWDLKCIEILLSDYKRVLKENEQLRTEVNSLKKENKELKTITNQYEAYECEDSKDSRAKIIIADKLYFNNGYFKNNFIEIDKIKKVFEDLEKIIKVGEGNV